jgi:serine/threonine protein kinase
MNPSERGLLARMARRAPTALHTTFETYTLGRQLGEGGAGWVFAATDESGNPCAVKLLNPERITSKRLKRWRNEVRFGEENKHPHVVTILDHGLDDFRGTKTHFYVMPKYGSSLRAIIGNLGDGDDRLKYYDQILSGIEAAHLKEIFHRDVKPENILIDSTNNRLVVADFGIAHFTDEELYTPANTRDADWLANHEYAAPEQLDRNAKVDHRADIYALGLMLNHMFTGVVPRGDGYLKIAQMMTDFGWLDPILAQMIQQNPRARPQTIDDVKGLLVAHRRDYIVRQELDAISNTVVPTIQITDPLAETDVTVEDKTWKRGVLGITLSHHVNATWVNGFKNVRNVTGTLTTLRGIGPENFSFSGNLAQVEATDEQAPKVFALFKQWLPLARIMYRETLRIEAEERERQARAELQLRQRELEQRQRVLDALNQL